MAIFKLGFFAVAAFISAVAIFVGCVLMLAFLKSGEISVSYLSGGLPFSETISRATDNDRFWRLFAAFGFAPVIVGAGVLMYSVRRIKSLT